MTPPATAAATAPRTRPRVAPRPRVSPPRPRRVSGPARGAARARPPQAPVEQGLALGVLSLARRVSGHRALDRLITSRLWIGLVAFALIGIVALQLLVLRLNSSIGDSLVSAASLQRENTALSIEGSELASGERVEAHAAHLGMQLVPIGSLLFLTSDPRCDLQRAAAALNTPVHGAGGSSQTGASATSAATASTTSTLTSSTTPTPTPTPSSASAPGEQPAGASEAAASTSTEAGASATSAAGAPGSAPAVSATSTPGAAAPTPEGEAGTASAGTSPAPLGAGGGVGAGQASGSG